MNTHADKTQQQQPLARTSTPVLNKPTAKQDTSSTAQPLARASTLGFTDHRPQAVAQRRVQDMIANSPQAQKAAQLQAMADNSPQVQRLQTVQRMINNSPQVQQAVQLQAIADNYVAQRQAPIQKKDSTGGETQPNRTGLPDTLKTGMENISGMSLDDVKVHYNSSQPAQLQAHAYAQGTDIHLASGQEKHLPHEAWHVVQQKQGRVQPTTQLKGKVNINDDAGLEREADIMGEKSLRTNPGTVQQKSRAKISTPAVQRQIDDSLGITKNNLAKKLQEAGYTIHGELALRNWFGREEKENDERILGSIEAVAQAVMEDLPDAIKSNKPKAKPKKKKSNPKPKSIENIDLEEEVKEEVKKPGKLTKGAKPERNKKHALVSKGEIEKLQINYVWVGNGALDALAVYNILSWTALGHGVTVYVFRPDKKEPTVDNLGIKDTGATVEDLSGIFNEDNNSIPDEDEKELTPAQALWEVHGLIGTWMGQYEGYNPENKDPTFNLVDAIKSYLGGTVRGIVLDLKVGPSLHLHDYEDAMHENFISYQRAGKGSGGVENQSMGIMAKDDTLRLKYAEAFASRMRNLLNKDITESGAYNSITGYHAAAFTAANGLNVSEQSPDKGDMNESYPVDEIKATNYGPFRVFKRADIQTHSDNPSPEEKAERAKQVYYLALDVYKMAYKKSDVNEGLKAQMLVQIEALKKIWERLAEAAKQ